MAYKNEKAEPMIDIKSISLSQVDEAKKLILDVAYHTWELQDPYETFEAEVYKSGEFFDEDNLDDVYFNNKGTFRMFIKKEYQNKGLGSRLLRELIHFAKSQGYKKMRLSVWYPDKQPAAIHLYKKFGFNMIAPYIEDGQHHAYMEKSLDD